jgi:hypothetical protein
MERPGLFSRLFGAEDFGEQWISLEYRDSSGDKLTFTLLLPAD